MKSSFPQNQERPVGLERCLRMCSSQHGECFAVASLSSRSHCCEFLVQVATKPNPSCFVRYRPRLLSVTIYNKGAGGLLL